jgi:hypothetical protein
VCGVALRRQQVCIDGVVDVGKVPGLTSVSEVIRSSRHGTRAVRLPRMAR